MVKTKAPGVHKVTSKLADGSRKTYYYAWRGGPAIKAEPDTREFMAEYVRLTRLRDDGPYKGCLAELIRDFTGSSAWSKLKPSTRDGYIFAINRIEAEFADFKVEDMTKKGARKMLLQWRDEMAMETPRMANMTLPVTCSHCGWKGRREPGNIVQCPKCGEIAAFQIEDEEDERDTKANF